MDSKDVCLNLHHRAVGPLPATLRAVLSEPNPHLIVPVETVQQIHHVVLFVLGLQAGQITVTEVAAKVLRLLPVDLPNFTVVCAQIALVNIQQQKDATPTAKLHMNNSCLHFQIQSFVCEIKSSSVVR